MSEKHLGAGGYPAEGSRETADRNLTENSYERSEKPTPLTPKDREGGYR